MAQLVKAFTLALTFAALLHSGALAIAAMAPALASEDIELALDDARRALEVMFSVTLTDQERAWYHAALQREGDLDPEAFWNQIKWLRGVKAEIESQDLKLPPYVNEEYRENYATFAHCGLEQVDKPDQNELLRILDRHNPVIYADCAKSLVIRKHDLNAWLASVNFVAELAGLAPLSSQEIADITEDTRVTPKSWNPGNIRLSSNWTALRYWWINMPEAVRGRNATTVAEAATDRKAIVSEVERLVTKSRHENRNLALCITTQNLVAGQALLLQETRNSVADVLTNPGHFSAFDVGSEAVGIFAPIMEKHCGNVWE